MTAPTMAKINASIGKHGVEVVKGDGYFYFADLAGASTFNAQIIPSVFCTIMRCMSLEDWIAHVETAIKNQGA